MTATFQLRRALSELYREHDVRPRSVRLALADPDPRPVLEGIASSPVIDCDRVKFLAGAFVLPKHPEDCPLLYEHDSRRVVGEVQDLGYGFAGDLLIRARVRDPEARRLPAFSVSARPLSWSVQDASSASFWVEISSAELVEVSLTATPRNPRAVVRSRHRLEPAGESHERLLERLARIQSVLQSMRGAMTQTEIEPTIT